MVRRVTGTLLRVTVMGIDLGGTSTLAELADDCGAVLGRGAAEGANLRSAGGGIAGAAAAVRRSAELALTAAVAGGPRPPESSTPTDPALIDSPDAADPTAVLEQAITGKLLPQVIVISASGAGAARHDEVAAAFRAALAGICDRVHVENDLSAAFRSASSGGDGYLLLSGTGAVAGRYRGGVLERRADGLGWILGDTGSGLWIGWQGLRAVAADLDRRGPHTELTGPMVASLEVQPVTGDPCQDLVRRVDELAPAQMGGLAPLVLAAAATDAVAGRIAEAAAEALITSLDAVVADSGPGRSADRPDSAPEGLGVEGAGDVPREVVLAGGVLAHQTPVRAAVLAELGRRGGWRAVTAADPVVGALRIAQDLLDAD